MKSALFYVPMLQNAGNTLQFWKINKFTRGKREIADKTEKILYSGGDFSPSANILYNKILNLGRGFFIHLAF